MLGHMKAVFRVVVTEFKLFSTEFMVTLCTFGLFLPISVEIRLFFVDFLTGFSINLEIKNELLRTFYNFENKVK